MRLVEEIKSLPEPQHHLAGTIHAGTQVKILALEIEHPSANAGHIVAGDHSARNLERLQFVLGLLAAAAPGRQFVGQVPEQTLEVGQRRLIRSNVW